MKNTKSSSAGERGSDGSPGPLDPTEGQTAFEYKIILQPSDT